MAHTCESCGCVCYGGGDIDDMVFDGGPRGSCSHCDTCNGDDDPYDDFDYDGAIADEDTF